MIHCGNEMNIRLAKAQIPDEPECINLCIGIAGITTSTFVGRTRRIEQKLTLIGVNESLMQLTKIPPEMASLLIKR